MSKSVFFILFVVQHGQTLTDETEGTASSAKAQSANKKGQHRQHQKKKKGTSRHVFRFDIIYVIRRNKQT
jgi:hypothetical protein